MKRRPPRSTRTDTLFPYTTLFRSDGVLHAEGVALTSLAQDLGTPTFVYSRNALRDAWHTYRHAMGKREVLVCYGMKANSNLAVLNEFKNLGAGFDIVSGGEIGRASCRERVCQYV